MASNTKTSTRVIFFLLALLFIVPIIVSGVFAIYNQTKSDKTTEDTTLNSNTLAGTKMENFTPITSPVDQLQTIDLSDGSGETLQAGATVTVNYTGALASTGVVFESSLDSGQPATFGLNEVISGWTEGLPGMKVGGTRRLIIPAEKAYGSYSTGTIPANADLVFDVTLIAINQ